MKRKTIWRIVFGSVGLILLLVITLVVHIILVTPKRTNNNNLTQLSRIDFKQPIDSVEASRIKSFVKAMPGVKGTYFNIPDGILVYSYTLGKQTSEHVYESLMQYGNYRAEKFIVTADAAAKGCPAGFTNDKSIAGRFTSFIQNLRN